MKTRSLSLGIMSMLMIILSLAMTSCGGKEDDPNPPEGDVQITLPAVLKALPGSVVKLQCSGVVVNAKLTFTSKVNTSMSYIANIDKVEGGELSFVLPSTMNADTYTVVYSRGASKVTIGDTRLDTELFDIPDVAGKNLKGCVFCNGVGVSGVAVTDGKEVTTTDDKGFYYLSSQKGLGLVYISVPANYEMKESVNSSPRFFAYLSGNVAENERHDFELISSSNDNNVVLTITDIHLAKRNGDISQYETGFVPDINATIAKYKGEGKKVYALNMGDTSWDQFWYTNNYAITDAVVELEKINCPIYTSMGNHDNDPYKSDDLLASLQYRKTLGPNYYSFNIGKTHYVVLDDIRYVNTGGSEGNVGSRNYDKMITAEQMEWLKKDLALVSDKTTPIVVGMHAQLYNAPTISANEQGKPVNALLNGAELQKCFDGFSDVRFLTGHTHINYSHQSDVNPSIYEYNTAAVCATWWWTGKSGYAGNHICKDGSVGGYGIWKSDGKSYNYVYKGMGYDEEYQFRVYDLNTTVIDASFCPKADDAHKDMVKDYYKTYGSVSLKDGILVNVFAFGPGWKIEITEEGKPLTVTRLKASDPLHIISYELQRLNVNATPTDDFVSSSTGHMFRAQASSSTSTIEVKVTDRWGKTYTQTVTRPKAFGTSMR